LVYIIAIWNIVWPIGIFCGHFGIFFLLWYVVRIKIWQPCIVLLFVLHKESLIVSPFEYRVVLPRRDLFRLKIAETDIGIDGLPWNVDIETSP
jgi:hypothetical protein